MSVLRTGRGRRGGGGGGVGWKFLLTEKKFRFFSLLNLFFQKCSWGSETHTNFFFGGGGFGVPHAPTRGSRGVGKRYTSSYDHDA